MKIKDIKSTPISIPYREPSGTSFGVSKASLSLVIQVYTDEGVTGIGHATSIPTPARTQAMIENEIKPLIVGEDPFNIERIVNSYLKSFPIRWALESSIYVIGGIEIALWDIIGKHLKTPVYRLLGGLCREKIPITAFLGLKSPEEMTKKATKAVEEGYKTIKVKVGRNPSEDITIVKAVRDTIGKDVELRVDANQAWSIPRAIRQINKMEKYDPEYIEQPIFRWDIDGLARVRKSVEVPIALCEGAVSIHRISEAIRREAADVISTDPLRVGGLAQLKKACGIAEAADIPLILHLATEGIATAAWLHFAASTASMEHAMDSVSIDGVGLVLTDDVITEPFKCHDGYMRVPEKPGLGIEIDQEKILKYSTQGQYAF